MRAISKLAVAVAVAGGVALVAVPAASAQAPPCAITSASVNSATATFTVGSPGCAGTVGPVSFSTYALPGGKVLPYNQQVAIAHHSSNGASYGEGTYTLTLTLNGAVCWQSDLYYGATVITPPHPHTIAVDYQQGPCVATDTPPVPSTTVPELPTPQTPTTQPEIPCVLGPDGHYSFAGTNIPCEGPAPATSVPCQEDEPCWDCATMGNMICGTTTVATLIPPAVPAPPSGGLPATGSDLSPVLAGLGVTFFLLGAICIWSGSLRRQAKRNARRQGRLS